jgi:hypothetical protein
MKIKKCTLSCPAYPGLLSQLIQLSPELFLALLQVPHHRAEVFHRLDEYGPLSKKIYFMGDNPETRNLCVEQIVCEVF